MKNLFTFLLLLLLVTGCQKYRLAHIGCEDTGPGLGGGTYVPNFFTPNGDGSNDTYQFYHSPSDTITNFYIVVKNNLGAKVFESNDPDFKWDGTHNGCPVKDDVYKVTTFIEANEGYDIDSLVHDVTGEHYVSHHYVLHHVGTGKGSITLYREDIKNLCAKHFDNCRTGSQWDGSRYNALLPTNEFFNWNCN